jgi:hypothetical protein
MHPHPEKSGTAKRSVFIPLRGLPVKTLTREVVAYFLPLFILCTGTPRASPVTPEVLHGTGLHYLGLRNSIGYRVHNHSLYRYREIQSQTLGRHRQPLQV